MEENPVKVRFRCLMTGCPCETILPARVSVREEKKFYQYASGPNCPECGHKLFSKHRPAGELPTLKIPD
jgi:DNA-directed RNA polymerase subunit RPC12/RpoP